MDPVGIIAPLAEHPHVGIGLAEDVHILEPSRGEEQLQLAGLIAGHQRALFVHNIINRACKSLVVPVLH